MAISDQRYAIGLEFDCGDQAADQEVGIGGTFTSPFDEFVLKKYTEVGEAKQLGISLEKNNQVLE